jgi:protein-L-isoaspartate(D-aspartate) O-methyltransferase
MRQVPREQFVAAAFQGEAYEDKPLAIGCGQTISQPSIVALMTESLNPEPHQRILEIGTGSGYQTAILSLLAGEVVTIERFPELAFSAARRLARLGRWNIFYLVGDGTLGWPSAAPFDGILVTASSPELPRPLWAQLAEGGVMVIPIGPRDEQVLYAVRKNQGQPIWYTLTPCRFVPLVGTFGWPKGAD